MTSKQRFTATLSRLLFSLLSIHLLAFPRKLSPRRFTPFAWNRCCVLLPPPGSAGLSAGRPGEQRSRPTERERARERRGSVGEIQPIIKAPFVQVDASAWQPSGRRRPLNPAGPRSQQKHPFGPEKTRSHLFTQTKRRENTTVVHSRKLERFWNRRYHSNAAALILQLPGEIGSGFIS